MFNLALGRMGRVGNITGIQRAIAFLRTLGTSAHVWLPGADGVSVASLPSNNYLLSDGSTGYSTVDGVDGLTLDGMGSLGSELVINGDFATDITGWTQVDVGTGGGIVWSAGRIAITGTNGANYSSARQTLSLTVGKTYLITFTVSGIAAYVAGTGPVPTANYLVGTYTMYVVAGAAQTLSFAPIGGTGTVYIDNISVKEYTGIHLTQATTANKPLVRRGAYNIATYSDAIAGGTGAWKLNTGATQAANNALSPSGTLTATRIVASGAGVNEGIYLSALSTVGLVEVFSLWLKGAVGGEQVMIGDASNRKTVTLTTSWARYSDNGATRGSNHSVIYAVNNTAMTFYASQAQLEAGTTAGDYTPTTATAASNPSSGKYWWSFDGSNDSLLSGNLAITTACTIVMSLRVNNLAATQIVFAEDTNGVQVSIATDGSVSLTKVGGAALVTTAAGVVVAGVPLVLTARLSAGTADIRKNSAQSATAASALTFAATTGARIGTAFNGTTSPTGGALGWVVPIAAALSDADCLTVERLVSSQFPNGPVL